MKLRRISDDLQTNNQSLIVSIHDTNSGVGWCACVCVCVCVCVCAHGRI